MKSIVLILLATVSFFSAKADALESPIGIGIVPPFQFPWPGSSVKGFRFSVARGINESVYGFDLGCMISSTTKEFAGSQFSTLLNTNAGKTRIYGFQLSLLGNGNGGPTDMVGVQATLGGNFNSKGTMIGVSAGLIGNMGHGKFIGAQVGAINQTEDLYGVQVGVLNSSDNFVLGENKSKSVGFQIGGYNEAENVYGFQIGLVNYAYALHGIQIGVININRTGWLKFFPIINAGF